MLFLHVMAFCATAFCTHCLHALLNFRRLEQSLSVSTGTRNVPQCSPS